MTWIKLFKLSKVEIGVLIAYRAKLASAKDLHESKRLARDFRDRNMLQHMTDRQVIVLLTTGDYELSIIKAYLDI